MTPPEYDKISLLYQFLTKRFDVSQNYEYNRFYKCYNSKHYGVREENLITLKQFENLSYQEILTIEYIKSKTFGEEYLNSKLLRIEKNRVCVHNELGQVFLYLLVSKLEIPIQTL